MTESISHQITRDEDCLIDEVDSIKCNHYSRYTCSLDENTFLFRTSTNLNKSKLGGYLWFGTFQSAYNYGIKYFNEGKSKLWFIAAYPKKKISNVIYLLDSSFRIHPKIEPIITLSNPTSMFKYRSINPYVEMYFSPLVKPGHVSRKSYYDKDAEALAFVVKNGISGWYQPNCYITSDNCFASEVVIHRDNLNIFKIELNSKLEFWNLMNEILINEFPNTKQGMNDLCNLIEPQHTAGRDNSGYETTAFSANDYLNREPTKPQRNDDIKHLDLSKSISQKRIDKIHKLLYIPNMGINPQLKPDCDNSSYSDIFLNKVLSQPVDKEFQSLFSK